MAEFHVVDVSDVHVFEKELAMQTQNGNWTVISSNAYCKDGEPRFYALLEKVVYSDYRYKVLDKLENIESNLVQIESNTSM